MRDRSAAILELNLSLPAILFGGDRIPFETEFFQFHTKSQPIHCIIQIYKINAQYRLRLLWQRILNYLNYLN